jgi:hypothetical protein
VRSGFYARDRDKSHDAEGLDRLSDLMSAACSELALDHDAVRLHVLKTPGVESSTPISSN